jgi:hypothetical protein
MHHSLQACRGSGALCPSIFSGGRFHETSYLFRDSEGFGGFLHSGLRAVDLGLWRRRYQHFWLVDEHAGGGSDGYDEGRAEWRKDCNSDVDHQRCVDLLHDRRHDADDRIDALRGPVSDFVGRDGERDCDFEQ